jgi:hypothetical protein
VDDIGVDVEEGKEGGRIYLEEEEGQGNWI